MLHYLQWSRHKVCIFTSELQDVLNSTFFGAGSSLATSSSNRMLWLHTLLSWLRVPLQEGLSYPIRSLGIRLLGRKVGLEPTTSKDVEPSVLPTELLASRNNNIKHFWLVVSGSSELRKTSTKTISITLIKFLSIWTLFEVHSPYLICPIPWMSGKSRLSSRKKW